MNPAMSKRVRASLSLIMPCAVRIILASLLLLFTSAAIGGDNFAASGGSPPSSVEDARQCRTLSEMVYLDGGVLSIWKNDDVCVCVCERER